MIQSPILSQLEGIISNKVNVKYKKNYRTIYHQCGYCKEYIVIQRSSLKGRLKASKSGEIFCDHECSWNYQNGVKYEANTNV